MKKNLKLGTFSRRLRPEDQKDNENVEKRKWRIEREGMVKKFERRELKRDEARKRIEHER